MRVRPAVQLRAVTKRFGATLALDAVDLTVGESETVVLVGPNGCGKTTLLRLVAGALEPDAGEIEVAGCDVLRDRSAARASIGMMFGADRGWYPRLTGRENLEFFARLEGLGRGVARAVDAALSSVALAAAAERQVRGYSAGMMARLGLARARLANPAVLLLDEPTATLDARSREDLTIRLREAEAGHAVLMATHDAEEATAVADRILVLRAGQVVRQLPGSVRIDELRRELAA